MLDGPSLVGVLSVVGVTWFPIAKLLERYRQAVSAPARRASSRGHILPPVLIEPGRGVAPWPIVGLVDVGFQAKHQAIKLDDLDRFLEGLQRTVLAVLADLVRVELPKLVEPQGDVRARFSGGGFWG
jgi:hypothetical protein